MMSSLWPVEVEGDFCLSEFLQSPLVHWALSLSGKYEGGDGQGSLTNPSDLCNSHFLKDVLDQIDPQLVSSEIISWQDDPVLHRLSVLESLVTNLRAYFTDILGQIMVMRPPDILFMSQFPGADHTASEMRKLLLLILSFAVQSGRKEEIIERIQNMDVTMQKGIVECIKEVTDNPLRVWKVELFELSDATIDHEHDRHLLLIAQQHLRNLVVDRQHLIRLVHTLWRDHHQLKATTAVSAGVVNKLPASPNQAVEVADLKTQIRRVTQDLYECQEELKECKEELKTVCLAMDALKEEKGDLERDTRLVKVYRDELDILYEKDKAAQKLEGELSRYRNQLVELEYYKNRIEELEQNWKLLTDTKNLLESQLESARKRTEVIPQLENDLCLIRHDLQNAILQYNANKDQVEDLLVANTQLSLELKRYRRHEDGVTAEDGVDCGDGATGSSLSLSDQLQESLSSKVLRLEIENEQLRAADRCHSGDVQLSCRHCLEKDSAIGTLQTSEDTCSTGDSSLEADHERHLESDPGYDTVDYKYSALPDPVPSREFLLNHVFDNSNAALREENFCLKNELVSLKASIKECVANPVTQVDDNDSSSHQILAAVQSELARLQQENLELSEQKLLVEEELAEEKKCIKEICAFLSAHNIEKDLTNFRGSQKGRKISERIDQIFSEKESDALQRSHEEILHELESLKNEYEQLRLAHDSDVDRIEATHANQVSALHTTHIREKQMFQSEIATIRISLENEVRCLSMVQQEMRQMEMAHENTLCAVHTKHENEKRALLSEVTSLRSACEMNIRSLRSAPTSISIGATCTVTPSDDIGTLTTTNQRLEAEVKSLRLSNSTLKKTLLEQERVKESLVKSTEFSQAANSTVMADHQTLQHYHEQLNTDYEKLSREIARLKSENKRINVDLEDARKKVVEASNRTSRDLDNVRVERLQRLEAEYEKLLGENESLRNANRHLGTTYRVLTEEHKTVKTEVNHLKLKKIEYDGVLFDCKNQVSNKEIEANKHTEILLGIIASLEDEKRSFAAAIERLVLQYDDVFLHSWRERNEMKTEHKDLQEKLHALNLQKQLLIQKLYDTFKATEARKSNISFMKRVRRAAGDLVGRSRSRTRAVSPTDSAADSSSVESNAGIPSDYNAGKVTNSSSMHSFKTLQVEREVARNGPQLSYSSDDLRKQSSSASSCISPTTDHFNQPLTYPLSKLSTIEDATPAALTDPAFHRVGSRRGIYRAHTTVVVHHPAVKATPSTSVSLHSTELSSTPTRLSRTERRVSLNDSIKSSSEKKKNCCSTYGGFHDCTMLNYTRLSATSSALPSDLSSLKRGSLDRSVERTSSTTTNESNLSPINTGRHRAIHLDGRPDSAVPKLRGSPVKLTEVTHAAHFQQASHAPRVCSRSERGNPGMIGRSDGATKPTLRSGDADSLSTWSFSASFNSLNLPQEASVCSSKYFVSDGGEYTRSAVAAPPTTRNDAIVDNQQVKNDDQVWFEYGCV